MGKTAIPTSFGLIDLNTVKHTDPYPRLNIAQ